MTTGRVSAREVIALVADDFVPLPHEERPSAPDGPLGWPGYDDARARAAERTGESESVVCGAATVEGVRAVLIAFEFGFLGGSLGERTGDRLVGAYVYAREHRLPVVPLVATGGSRMQEGMLALTQLQRVARQSALTREAGLPQVAVLRDPTTGGGWATLGAGADVVLALPGAQVGFAGSRVRPPDADPAAYTAEAQVAAGAADAVVPAARLREVLGLWLRLLTDGAPPAGPAPDIPAPSTPAPPPTARTGAEDQRDRRDRNASAPGNGSTADGRSGSGTGPTAGGGDTADRSSAASRGSGAGRGGVVEAAPAPRALGEGGLPVSGWDAVRRARSRERPRAGAYLDAYFTRRLAISGDRCGGVDPDGMLCGFGVHEGRTVAYAAQTGAATRPAGYRTAVRLIRLAERLGIPVLTLVDTPGAANDAEAERQGAGAAIAELFGVVAAARTPITTLVIGEGGSGGALALAAPGRTWATPDSYFSVIAPEAAAAILKRPPAQTEATADQLRLRPQDLVELGVIRATNAP
ncbi:carboxyl transferase domain-containing protein [Streptomyces hilarionis]|uniref:carboxyl transferase domain-containing protein n=1 Tax=Streptomyces hilarionis TaxID=2839954 RepID=UPI002119F421|nr:carboxyl transferase domain-containing protein [Streptomyces hilarionis]MCQ9135246.1 acetyl-CoA carboxylase carboxyl transferase subunit alpha/beta [Streptomyces hilarionis]